MTAHAACPTRCQTRRRPPAGAQAARQPEQVRGEPGPRGHDGPPAQHRGHGHDRAADFRLPGVRRRLPGLFPAVRHPRGVAHDLHGRGATCHRRMAAGEPAMAGRALALPRHRATRGRGLKGARRAVRQGRGRRRAAPSGSDGPADRERDHHRGQGRDPPPRRPRAGPGHPSLRCLRRSGNPTPATRTGCAASRRTIPSAPASWGTPARDVVQGVADWGFGHAHPFTPARQDRRRGGGRSRAC